MLLLVQLSLGIPPVRQCVVGGSRQGNTRGGGGDLRSEEPWTSSSLLIGPGAPTMETPSRYRGSYTS
jgi:hypothetical protein